MIVLNKKDLKRLQAVRRVLAGLLSMDEACQLVGLSKRQMRRIVRAVEQRGDQGILHGNRGRAPSNRADGTVRKRVVELARKKYAGFNDTHLTDKLVELEGLDVSRATVRRWLRDTGVVAARRRRPARHHRRRERKPQAGMMLLWDGSRHDWLEGRGPMLCLVGAIDDATSEFLPGARFVPQECSAAYMAVLKEIAETKGLPWASYGDRHSIFRRTDDTWTLEEELRGEQDPTQLGRALKALEIERIDALSPQAKGRVERLWGTLQDRLVSELRLAKACDSAAATSVLTRYRDEHNQRFAVPAAETQSAWRSVGRLDLERVLSFRYDATVLNDNTVRVDGMIIDIPPGPSHRSYARQRVEVRQLLDGSWRVYHEGRIIARHEATELDVAAPRRHRKRPAASRVFRRLVERLG
jgi:transposase